jgi:predicted nicotinamide N-methyase
VGSPQYFEERSEKVPVVAAGYEYDGPVTTEVHRFGSQTIHLVRPADPDRLLDDPAVLEWNRRDDYMPYWGYLWPGAYLLAERLAQVSEFESCGSGRAGAALEIGCGLGMAGLVAVARGMQVLFTDYDPVPLHFVARSAVENRFDRSRFSTRLLDWRDLPDDQFSLIFGADVIYERRLIPMVVNLLDRMLAAGGLGLIASPYRVAAEDFASALAGRGLKCQAEAAGAKAEGRLIEGTIYEVRRA